MSTEAWIFMVGMRVFDVGALIVWLVWFFKLRDEDPDDDEEPRDDRPDDGDEPLVTPPGPSAGGQCDDAPRVRLPWRDRARPRRPAEPRRVRSLTR